MTEVQEQIPTRVDQFLNVVEKGNKPWFLSTMEIYKIVKKAAASVPTSEVLLEQCLTAIGLVTRYINDNTGVKIAIDAESSYDLITKIDAVLSEQLIVVDDGFDGLRGKLSSSLRQLLVALVHHKNWIESKAIDTKEGTKTAILTRYERALGMLTSLLNYVKDKYPALTQTANGYIDNAKQTVHTVVATSVERVDNTIFGTIRSILRTAQPYVQNAVQRATPLVAQAVEVSQPIIVRAKPYVDPWVERANDVDAKLLQNQLVGSYVAKAHTIAHTAFDEAKAYCIPPNNTTQTQDVPAEAQ